MRLDNPILVTGSPRSGKTCVAQMLNHLPEFHRVEEPLMIWDIGMGIREDDRRSAEEATPALRAEIVDACASLIAMHPAARYVDDLSYHALRVPFVHALMPEARIIHVIRDCAGAVPEMVYGWMQKDTVTRAFRRRRRSLRLRTLPRFAARFLRNKIFQLFSGGRRATWGPRVPDLKAFSKTHSVAEIAAFQWLQMVTIARSDLSELPHERWLEVRYDRLLMDPRGEAKRIGEFCQVENIDELVRFTAEYIDPEFVNPYRIEPSESEWQSIRELVRAAEHELGYATDRPPAFSGNHH